MNLLTRSLLIGLSASGVLAAEDGPREARVQTSEVEYRDGDQVLRAFVAYDASRKGRLPAVLIFPEWWGQNDYVKNRARQLAGLGYMAMVADMYGGAAVITEAGEAGRRATELKGDRERMRRRAHQALSTLKEQAAARRDAVVAIGYCLGGTCALELARSGAELRGVVSFHGNLDTPQPRATPRPTAGILVCHGAADPHVPTDTVAAFVEEMNGCGADWQLNMYGSAVHSFTNPEAGSDPSGGSAYRKDADDRSWQDMLTFFRRVLPAD